MFLLTVFRPELVVDKFNPKHPFEGFEVLGLFDGLEAVNKEIDYWQNLHSDWQFQYEDAPEKPVERWGRHAAEIGVNAAKSAASWVTDGNESDESRRHKLKLINEGDPAIDSYLPRQPDLSGEFGDDYNVEKLVEEVTGRNANELDMADRETIINNWEDAVHNAFLSECEKELLKWVSD